MFKQTQLKTYLYRACPRCRGDLVLDPEVEQSLMLNERLEYVGLQCGGRISLDPSKVIWTPAVTRAA
jgi:uncharacterized protein YbaR (Trm112 family)